MNPLRAWPMVVVLALLPIWTVGLFGRCYWTPDEPREADIAWEMMRQPDKSVPEMAGAPFAEKPPLAYWAAAASMSAFGASPAMARLPNLAYAILSVLAVATLARSMRNRFAAIVAGVAAGSFMLVYQVSIWLATDAPLVAGVSLALLGLYRGFTSPRGRDQATWYALMHIGMLIGFLAKGPIAWLMPVSALLVLVAWEGRWSELRQWELCAGLLLQFGVIGFWVWNVAQRPDGGHVLEILFWYNLAGRFVPLHAAAASEYTHGHHNWFGKYILQAPAFLAPWTLLAVAAGRYAYSRIRSGGLEARPWIFIAAAVLPTTLLLSASATARGIYLAPVLPPVGVMIGLWASERLAVPDRVELWLLRATAWLVIGLICAIALALPIMVVAAARAGQFDAVRTALGIAGCAGAAMLGMSALRRVVTPVPASALGRLYAAFAVLLVGTGLFLMPVVDRSQDLRSVAVRVRALAGGSPLALFEPDETTIAMFDYDALAPRPIVVAAPDETVALSMAAALATHDRELRWLVQLPRHASGPVTELLSRLHLVRHTREASPQRAIAPLSAALGVKLLAVVALPEGRWYALLGAENKP